MYMLNENEISQKSRVPLSVFYQKGLHYFLFSVIIKLIFKIDQNVIQRRKRMGLKSCPDCGKSVSTWVITCPNCGRYFLPQCGECYYYDSEDRRCSKYYNKKNVRSNSPACADYEVDD